MLERLKGRRRWLLVVLALAAAGVRLWLALPKTYTEAEITEELCLKLAPLDNGASAGDIPLRMVEIRKVDDVILGAYVWENNPRSMGYLRFEPTNNGRYRLGANRSGFLMWQSNTMDAAEVFTTHDEAGELHSYYILLCSEKACERVEVYDTGGGEERLAAEFAPGGEPAVCVWERPEAGRYVALQADGSEYYKRHFAVNRVWDDEVDLEFMLDWQDLWVGGSGTLVSRVTLLSEPKRRLGEAELSVVSPTHMAWCSGKPIGDCGGHFAYRQEAAETGAYYTSPGQEVSLPVEFDYQRGGWAFDNYSRHMTRAVNVRYDKKYRLQEPGDYLEGIFTYADYVNMPQEPADMQAVWHIENGCELGRAVQVEILDR